METSLESKLDIRSPEIQAILEQCIRSTRATSKVLFPDRFSLPFSRLHDQIFQVLDDDNQQLIVIAAPRGFGKTSIVNLAYPTKKIVFREKKFIVPISNTATQALMQGENLKRELLSNSAITRFFGPMKSSMFSQDQWVTETGTMVLPRGSGQQVRGILFGDERPDLIICDDLEDSEGVKNEEQRKKLKEWFFSDVMNSINRARKNWKIIVIGTLLHEDSLLANLLEDPRWSPVLLELFDDNYKSNWPEFMSDEDVVKLVDTYRSQKMLSALFREYRNVPVATEDAKFKGEYFQYYDVKNLHEKVSEYIVLMDPAKTSKASSDESASVAVGLDLVEGRLYIVDIISGHYHPDKFIDETLDLCVKWHARVLGFEETSLHEFISYPLENAMRKRGLILELVPLNARANKEDRVAALIPFYRRGEVWHNRIACGGLEKQLLSYPRSKRWDIMDALAYAVPLLEKGQRYFLAKDEKATEKEYKVITNKEEDFFLPDEDSDYGEEVVSQGSWRSI